MDKFEILKSQTIQFSLFDLLHFRLSNYIVERICQIDNTFQNNQIIKKGIVSVDDINELQVFFENKRNALEFYNLYDACIEELREIKSDIKWVNSNDGKLIIKIEHWVESARKKISEHFYGYKIFVGRSLLNPKELIIGGMLKNELEIEIIKKELMKETPPVLPIYKFEIEI